ncbi:hypothetical protein [Paracoccus sp. (in: a-proteobacteria)]|uniref:hypothetical protein n=1 Tax=Paracoccus sp. TaxID=267 RepID=UPI003220044C
MDRTEFIIATSIILFAVFLLGWCASWLVQRLTRVTHADMAERDSMARQLHEAEETRDRATAALQTREAELLARLAPAEAELSVARDELRQSRAEIEELRGYIARKLGRQG